MKYYGQFESAFGPVAAALDERGALTRFVFLDGLSKDKTMRADERRDDVVLEEVKAQVDEYFTGQRQRFELRLAPLGTPFQQQIWQALLTIPYAETCTYGQLAAQLGRDSAARAVGRANGSNPIGLIIPCHRVIGADGSLTGYGGGLPLKRRLLAFEKMHQAEAPLFALPPG